MDYSLLLTVAAAIIASVVTAKTISSGNKKVESLKSDLDKHCDHEVAQKLGELRVQSENEDAKEILRRLDSIYESMKNIELKVTSAIVTIDDVGSKYTTQQNKWVGDKCDAVSGELKSARTMLGMMNKLDQAYMGEVKSLIQCISANAVSVSARMKDAREYVFPSTMGQFAKGMWYMFLTVFFGWLAMIAFMVIYDHFTK